MLPSRTLRLGLVALVVVFSRSQVVDIGIGSGFDVSRFNEAQLIAEQCAAYISAVYNFPEGSLTPAALKQIVLSNVRASNDVYGSAVAFAPGVYHVPEGASLLNGVGLEAAGVNIPGKVHPNILYRYLNQTLYSPFAFGENPIRNFPIINYNSTADYAAIDLTYGYTDEARYTDNTSEWYFVPMQNFYDNVTGGHWSNVYLDEGAGNINMTTYSATIASKNRHQFLGVCTIDIPLSELCFGDNCTTVECFPVNYTAVVSSCDDGNERTISYTALSEFCESNFPPPPDATFACSYVPSDSKYGISVIAVAVSGAVVNFIVLLVVIYFRKHVLIRYAQPNICYGFLVGAVASNLGMLLLLGENTDTACVVRIWAFSVPPIFTVACLFAKVYRVHKLFTNTSLKRIHLSDLKLAGYIAMVVAVNLAVLGVWNGGYRPKAATRDSNGEINPLFYTGDLLPDESYCDNMDVFPFVLDAYLFLLLAFGLFLSFSSRHLPGAYSEAQYICVAMVFAAGLYGIGFLLWSALNDVENHKLRTFVAAVIMALCTTLTTSVVFVPKFYWIRTKTEDECKAEAKRQIAPSNKSIMVELQRYKAKCLKYEDQLRVYR